MQRPGPLGKLFRPICLGMAGYLACAPVNAEEAVRFQSAAVAPTPYSHRVEYNVAATEQSIIDVRVFLKAFGE